MGTDFRRAWETAPAGSFLIFIAAHLTSSRPHQEREFSARLLSVLGGDEAAVANIHARLDARTTDFPPGVDRVTAVLSNIPPALLSDISQLPAFQRSGSESFEHDLAELLRARVSYDDLMREP